MENPEWPQLCFWDFFGLLRAGRILSLTKDVFTFHGDSALLVIASKTANEDIGEEKQSMYSFTAKALLIWPGMFLPIRDPGKVYLT